VLRTPRLRLGVLVHAHQLTKASVSARLKDIKNDREAADEGKVLGDYLARIERESAVTAKAKAAQE
jgi:type I restriction enzyme M protein